MSTSYSETPPPGIHGGRLKGSRTSRKLERTRSSVLLLGTVDDRNPEILHDFIYQNVPKPQELWQYGIFYIYIYVYDVMQDLDHQQQIQGEFK